MKSWVLIFALVIILLAGLGFLYIQRAPKIPTPASTPTPTPTPILTPSPSPTYTNSPQQTSSPTSFCTPQDLQAILDLSPGAGNVYGTFTLKNISGKDCQIQGGNFIKLGYDSSVKNIQVSHQGQTQPEPFTLPPNQTLYSQVHYPNGPQCSGPTNPVNVTFTYQISPKDTVTFKGQANNIPQVVQDCKSQTEITQVQIWQLSTQPITPQ